MGVKHRKTDPQPNDIVTYAHPDWGPSRGRVLSVGVALLLVQDLAPNGAREWWPIGECRRENA